MSRAQEIVEAVEREQKDGGHMVAACCGACGGDDCEKGDDCEACEQCADFTWQSCDLCPSHLGGERHAAALIYPGTDREPLYYSVCVDCLVFLANGDLPENEENDS